jgi:hypothetical protein
MSQNASVQNTQEFKNLERIMDALYRPLPVREMREQGRDDYSKTVNSLVQAGITAAEKNPTDLYKLVSFLN